MSDAIRIGIIGVGQIGKHHLQNYQKIPGVQIVAAADLNEAELNRVAEVFQIPQVYTNYSDLLKCEDILAVDVCLHNNLHKPVSVAALRAGKHVYCEKPMAGSYRDALSMYQTAQELNLKLSIQLSTLFSKETRAAKVLLDEGMLGKVYHARSTGFRRRGRPYVDGYGTYNFVKKHIASGGALYDMGVYHIANMLYLLGNPQVARISGKVYQETEMDAERRRISNYDVEELGIGLVKFNGGITLDLIEAWAIHLDGFEGSSLAGTRGGLRLSPFGFFQNVGDLSLNSSANLDSFIQRLHDLRPNADAYDSPQHHWAAALQGRVPLLPTAELALNTMLISEGIYLSDRLEREVSAGEVSEMSESTAVEA